MGPSAPLPAGLRVKSQAGPLHVQQDEQSELIAKLGRGEDLVVLGNASSAGEAWDMMKTKGGRIGWIKANDVEDATKARREERPCERDKPTPPHAPRHAAGT